MLLAIIYYQLLLLIAACMILNLFNLGNHKDYLTLVSLSTMPPQICQGSGSTLENSRNAAALNAISSLVNLNIPAEPTQQGPVNGFSIQQNHYNSNPITRLIN
ncbi:double-stranded RNA-binding protein Staufen 2 isoform X3, partial [Aphis craccivora]